MNIPITKNIGNWLINGERGVSSNAIVAVLTGNRDMSKKQWDYSPPADPADLRRCMLLLEACPELRPHLHRMSEVSETWGKVAQHFDELVSMMKRETANSHSAPSTYRWMKELGC